MYTFVPKLILSLGIHLNVSYYSKSLAIYMPRLFIDKLN